MPPPMPNNPDENPEARPANANAPMRCTISSIASSISAAFPAPLEHGHAVPAVVAHRRAQYSRGPHRKPAEMPSAKSPAAALKPIDSLVVEVITDDVSDTYVSKTLFAVSEFSNVVMAGAKVISGEALLCANLGFGLKLVSEAENVRHTMLFDTGPEGAIFIRNCGNLGIRLGEVESIAVSHGHWDHMAALPHAVEAIMKG